MTPLCSASTRGRAGLAAALQEGAVHPPPEGDPLGSPRGEVRARWDPAGPGDEHALGTLGRPGAFQLVRGEMGQNPSRDAMCSEPPPLLWPEARWEGLVPRGVGSRMGGGGRQLSGIR